MKRFSILIVIVFASTWALAQKADVAFVVGGSFVSDSKQVLAVPCTPPFCPVSTTFLNVKTDHHMFLEGTVGVRLADAKLVSLHVELPLAGIPTQNLSLSSTPSGVIDQLSTVFITPSLRLKVLPGAPISPWVSAGGGWARYSLDSGPTTNKGAIQYGGGLDFKTGLPLLGFRAEVRDFVTGDPNFSAISILNGTGQSGLHHHNVLVGGGLVLRF